MFKPSPAHRNTVWAFLAQMVTFWHLLLRSADLAAAAQGQPALHTPDTLFPTAGRIDNISVRSLRHGGARHSRCARWGAEGKHETKITRVKTQSHTAEPAWSQAFNNSDTEELIICYSKNTKDRKRCLPHSMSSASPEIQF